MAHLPSSLPDYKGSFPHPPSHASEVLSSMKVAYLSLGLHQSSAVGPVGIRDLLLSFLMSH